MGDFNAQVGSDNDGYENILGKNAIGRRNTNGELLLELCMNFDLKIGGLLFLHKQSHKTTWKSPGGNYENQIDHICISRKWCNILCDVRNKRSAEIGSDHYLIVAEIKLKLFPKKSKQSPQIKPFDVEKLKSSTIRNIFSNKTSNINLDICASLEEKWKCFKDSITDICKTVLGFKRNEQEKDWMTNRSWELIEERKNIKLKMIGEQNVQRIEEFKNKHKHLSNEIKKQIKKDKKCYYERLGNEAQTAANKGNTKDLYKIIRQLSGKNSSNTRTPVEDETGNLITSKDDQTKLWKNHFEKILNINQNHQEPFHISRMHPTNEHITTENPSRAEIKEAIDSLKNGKASGNDGIPAECFKACSDIMTDKLYTIFNQIWEEENIPHD